MNRFPLFPDSVTIKNNQLSIGGCDLASLADQYGTPLYVYDRITLEQSAEKYKSLLATYYTARSSVTYAGKAYLSVPIARWAAAQNLTVDCTGLGEIAISVKAGVPRGQMVVHGVNKSQDDLLAAIEHAGTIVVDNFSELQSLAELARNYSLPELWLRLQPGMAVDTHAYTQTGHEDSKFGMDYKLLLEAAAFCKENDLPLKGIHFHQGSQFRDPEPLVHGVERALDAAKEIGFSGDWHLSPGGGWGVAYHEDDLPHPSLEMYVRFTAEYILSGCHSRGLSLPHLHLEPGRSIVARAGVALYRIGTIKRTAHRTWLLIDGGMADNLRPALYGVKYSALPVHAPDRTYEEKVWIAGPYCESGDVIIEGLPFPKVKEGELIAVPVAGAYQLSMASNYNGARKPAVLMLDNGKATLMQARETTDDLIRRDK
jgi:diaminopimelate decarboxylase